MAKSPPPEHSRFKKGQSGNPLGAKMHNPVMKKMKNLTEAEMIEIGSMILKGNIEELKAVGKDPKASALKCMMAAVAVKTISKGDAQALNILLDRLIGKVKERVEVTGANGGPQVIVSLPSNGREVRDVGESD